MANLSITAANVAAVSTPGGLYEAVTGPAAEAISAGQYCRLNVTSGTIELGNGTTAVEARSGGVAISTANAANVTITMLRKGYIDVGNALSSLAYDADVYLSNTDGTLSSSAGTVSLVVATVVPSYGATTAEKMLRVNL